MREIVIYLATPYVGTIEQMESRFDAVTRVAGDLMRRGKIVYSPITHCHPIATRIDLPRDWSFWERIDRTILLRCDELWVLCVDGWEQSKGVASEIEIAKSAGLPVRYLSEDQVRLICAARWE